MTGLRIINGGGKAEAQAAHIWAVQDGGPDVVRNGIALSATVHWLFDRHLISLTDDYGLLVSHNRVSAELRPLYERQLERIILPSDSRLHLVLPAGRRTEREPDDMQPGRPQARRTRDEFLGRDADALVSTIGRTATRPDVDTWLRLVRRPARQTRRG